MFFYGFIWNRGSISRKPDKIRRFHFYTFLFSLQKYKSFIK